ncbi:hypothetical protein E6R60_13730 [Streptomyces sp. A0642]|uniref:hypothetical protein n=1 Tax=Streptomyces sp. A0642 TaxID=2563100 RepID=UPI0010A27A54|nr:hypothetical protein E6R60_13730 [Streptomyces sp. A0642]
MSIRLTALTALVRAPRPGYGPESWDGTVPAPLARTFTASRRALDDMPMDGADSGTTVGDVDRVRAVAQAVADRVDLLGTVAAVDESDGSVAGFTELVVPGDGPGDGQQCGTGVLPSTGAAAWPAG